MWLLLFSGMPSDLNQKALGGLSWLTRTFMCHWESGAEPFLPQPDGSHVTPARPLKNLE